MKIKIRALRVFKLSRSELFDFLQAGLGVTLVQIFICLCSEKQVMQWFTPLLRRKSVKRKRGITPVLIQSSCHVFRVTRAVRSVSHWIFFKPNCLIQAITAQLILMGRGVPTEFCIGVWDGALELSGSFLAHAWLEWEGHIILGELDEIHRYQKMVSPLISFLKYLPEVRSAEFVPQCQEQGVTSLLYIRARDSSLWESWPKEVQERIESFVQRQAALELQRQNEICRVLEALGEQGIEPLILKGTALAYTLYESPSIRPRLDTDLLIRTEDAPRVKKILKALGYREAHQSDPEILFGQFILEKSDDSLGQENVFDFHLEISCRKLFSKLLQGLMNYERLKARAVPIVSLGPWAFGLDAVSSLLLACIHPVMHHHNEQRLIWIYDFHLIIQRMTDFEFQEFFHLAGQYEIRQICDQALQASVTVFGTVIPAQYSRPWVLSQRYPEITASYLDSGRRWHHEFWSDFQALQGWGKKLQFLRASFFPSPSYMFRAYIPKEIVSGTGESSSFFQRFLLFGVLPFLYGKRIIQRAFSFLGTAKR